MYKYVHYFIYYLFFIKNKMKKYRNINLDFNL